LYQERQPIDSLRRVEQLGSWTTGTRRATSSGSSFGFACQRTPGDPHPIGSHARGTVVSLNPWENPTRGSTVGAAGSWWLTHRGHLSALPYVHTSSSAVVRAFAAQGFSWNGSSGRYAEFRDVR
jgi:hypothetical protein